MKNLALIIGGIILFAVIILMIAVEIIEFTIGAILLGIAALILWGVWKWLKGKVSDK
jgi:hypothetical protein